jgi:hypothetical protein
MNWQPLNLTADEYAKPTEPPAILGLIYRGKRHGISGPPESAKTLLALAIGLEWYRAGLGRFALIDFEQGAATTRLLLEELGATKDELADIYYVEADAPPTPTDINMMLPAGVTLAIVDAAAGAYDASGLDDNKRADVERFARTWIVPLWQVGCTTLLLDHVVKNSETRGRYAIGSERKALGPLASTRAHGRSWRPSSRRCADACGLSRRERRLRVRARGRARRAPARLGTEGTPTVLGRRGRFEADRLPGEQRVRIA